LSAENPQPIITLDTTNWWGILGSNQSCRKAADLQSAESPLILLPQNLAASAGLEPATHGLTVRYSTN
jgi:hypothetical protein